MYAIGLFILFVYDYYKFYVNYFEALREIEY